MKGLYAYVTSKYPTRKAYPWQSLSRDSLYKRIYRGDFDDRQLIALKPLEQRLTYLKNLTPARNQGDNPLIPEEVKRYRPELQRAYLLEIARQNQQN